MLKSGKMFKNIILATDGSKHAGRATDVAADIAARYGATLTLLTVVPASLSLSKIEAMPQARKFSKEVKADIAHFRDAVEFKSHRLAKATKLLPAPPSAIQALGEGVLDAAVARAKKRGVKKIERVVITGHPAEIILTAARGVNADLIVMGTRGLSDLKGIFVGSVSHKVMQFSGRPCLTVR